MSHLENLEAKMANIEVSLSSSIAGRKRRGTSLGGVTPTRVSPRPKEPSPTKHDTDDVIQNLRIHLCLGKLSQSMGPPMDNSERMAAERKLIKLKIDVDNKRIAIRNLKSALDRLDLTDNIDTRIRQAELEYALGREELQLLSFEEEVRALQTLLDKLKPESNSLYNIISSGVILGLHAVQATVGRWAAGTRHDCPGLYVEWALDREGLYRGDRIIEANGKIVTSLNKKELQRNIGTSGKCQLVVIRKKTAHIPHQQLIQQQEDNLRLQHRISYLEEQVRELRTVKDVATLNGTSGHITSINISSPSQPDPPCEAKPFRGSQLTTLATDKTIVDLGRVTKAFIKQKKCYTDTDNNYLPSIKPLSSSVSTTSINRDLYSYSYKRERERNSINRNFEESSHKETPIGHCNTNHAISVENLNSKGIYRRKEVMKRTTSGLRTFKSLDFDSDSNDQRRNGGYTSEPGAPRIRPIPPKKPLRLSLQRAQSLQIVELNIANDAEKKKPVKRMHNGERTCDLNLTESTSVLQTASLGRNKHI